MRTLRDAGHEAYFAGGCVRDELLGLEPLDYDVATDARPERIQALFRQTAAVGASFGVVLVRERGVTVEVATFRSDGPYSDRRRPDSIEFADAARDAQRRDFTVNALFLDPLAAADAPSIRGHVIDHVGGLADLDARVIRAVGAPDDRLAEDHLRALRAVRFAARYGFAIEPATAGAIRRHASDLAGVSRERIGDEVRRMLAAPSRAGAATLLEGLGLEAVVFGPRPEGGASGGALARLGGEGATFVASLAALALDRGEADAPGPVGGLLRRWRGLLCLSNAESTRLGEVLRGVLGIEAGWADRAVARRKRWAASVWFAEALAVVRARDAELGEAVRADVASLAADGVGLAPPALINGNDLLTLGLSPGPVFARVLDGVYDAQLEGRVRDVRGALALAGELAAGRSV